jgi:hypothetical protein
MNTATLGPKKRRSLLAVARQHDALRAALEDGILTDGMVLSLRAPRVPGECRIGHWRWLVLKINALTAGRERGPK